MFMDAAEDCGTVTGKDQRSSRADLYRKLFSEKAIVHKTIMKVPRKYGLY